MSADDFRVYFTPLAGVLFTVPSRYCALSVIWGMEPWEVVSPASDPVLRAGPYLRLFPKEEGKALRGCHPLWRRVPNVFVSPTNQPSVSNYLRRERRATPRPQGGSAWHGHGLGVPRFVRHYYGDIVCSSGYVRCFSWPGTRAQCAPTSKDVEVALLGNRRIKACMPLPSAYRSGAASVIGPIRRGIHRLLLLSCRCYCLCSSAEFYNYMSFVVLN